MRRIKMRETMIDRGHTWSGGFRTPGALLRGVVVTSALCVLSVSATGCGELTAGGAGEVEVVVGSDEEVSPGAELRTAGSFAVSPVGEAASFRSHAGSPSVAVGPLAGQMRLTLAVSLIDADGEEVPLTDGQQAVELELAAGSRAEIARASVSPGEYQGFRVVFTRVEASVTSSPGQSPFPPEVTVDLAGDPLIVDRGPGMSLGTDDSVRVLVDLRARTWIMAADPSDGRVARGILRSAVQVQVEQPD